MRLPTDKQIKRIMKLWKEMGLEVGRVDILDNGVAVYPPAESGDLSPYDKWKNQDNARPPHS